MAKKLTYYRPQKRPHLEFTLKSKYLEINDSFSGLNKSDSNMFQLLKKENFNYYRKKDLVYFCLTEDVNKRGIIIELDL